MKTTPIILASIALAGSLATAPASASTSASGAAVQAAALGAASSSVGTHYGRYGYRGYRGGYGFRGYFGYRSYYRPYGYGYGFGYYPRYRAYRYGYYPYGFPAYGYPSQGYKGQQQFGSIDLKVKPSKTEVYVDGRYVGVAGQFDGFPSYLWLDEGVHQVVFYKNGFETVQREISVQPGHRVDLRVRMVEGKATPPDVLVPAADDESEAPAVAEVPDGEPGRLTVTVAPDDAVVYVDGHFFGVASELASVRSGLLIDAGEHTIEIVRPGYRTVERTVRIEPGKTATLDATLRPR